MDHFNLKNGVMHAEDVPLTRIAEEIGTPVYVYSRATLERHARVFMEALSGIERSECQSEFLPVQQRDPLADDAGFFKCFHPAETGRRRQADTLGERLVGQGAILLELGKDAAIDTVKGWRGHGMKRLR